MEHNRLKMYQKVEKSYFIPPSTYEIREREIFSANNNKIHIASKSIGGSRVPLAKNLKIFLDTPGIFQ